MAIRTKNLNLIPLLQALLEEENVAKAADKMALSQPAMSAALSKLRDTFKDELMVRNGRSMELTPRAHNLKERLNSVCTEIDLLFQSETFDPTTANTNFRISCPHYMSTVLVDSMLEKISTQAKGITLDFVSVPSDLPHWLSNSAIDIAVCANFNFWPDLPYEHLFHDKVVALTAQSHPLNNHTNIHSDELNLYPIVRMNEDANSPFLNKNTTSIISGIPGIDFKSQFTCMSQFTSIFMTLKSEAICRVPLSLAKRITKVLPFKIHTITGEKNELNTGIFWNKINETSPEHQWLRSTIKESLHDFLID